MTDVAGVRVAAASARSLWPTVLCTLYIAAVPPQSWLRRLDSYDEQRVLAIGLVTAVAVGCVIDRGRRKELMGLLRSAPRSSGALAVVLLVGVVSSAMSLDPWTGIVETSSMGALVLLGLNVAVDVRRDPGMTLTLVAGGAVVSAAWYAADLLTFPGVDVRGRALHLRGAAGGFVNPRFMNQYQLIVLALATPLAVDRRLAGWIRGLISLVMVVTWWMLLLTEPRGAIVALVVACAAAALVGRIGRRLAALYTGGAVLGAAAVVAFRLVKEASLLSRSEESLRGSSGRLAAWQDALSAALDQPLLGIGPGHLAHVEVVTSSSTLLAHPHNSVVQIAAEWGLPAALVVVVGVAVGLWAMFTGLRAETAAPDHHLRVGVFVAAIALTAYSLVSGVLTTPVGQVALALAWGAVLGLLAARVEPRQGTTARAVAVLVWALVLTPGVLVAEGVGSSAGRDWETTSFIEQGGGVLHPRFWNQGYRGPAG